MSVEIKMHSENPYYYGTARLDGNVYQFTFRWNTHNEKWYADIESLNDSSVSVKGIPLLCGKDLLAPYGFHQLGSMHVVDNSGANEDPDYENVGSRFTLEYTPIEQ